MQYTEDTETSLEVNIVSIAVAGTIAAAICIPGMLVFAAAFHPQILVNLAMWAIPLIFSCPAKCWRAKKRVLRFLFCWPCMLRRAVRVTIAQMRARAAETRRQANWAKVQARVRGELAQLPDRASSFLPGAKARTDRRSTRQSSTGAAAAPAAARSRWCASSGRQSAHAPAPAAVVDVDVRTRLRFAAAGLTAQAGGAAGPGVTELQDKDRGRAADARWGVLCSAPVVERMQRDTEEASRQVRGKQRSVIDFMRKRLAEDRQAQCKDTLSPDGDVAYEAGDRIFRYDSLNEHLVMLSLSRAVKQREWRMAARLTLGWLLNHFFFVALLLVFVVYGCVFDEMYSADETETDKLLMFSWAWSILQRFVLNEPIIILVSVLLPMLLATECCANMCTESCNNVLGVAVAMLMTFLRRMRRV